MKGEQGLSADDAVAGWNPGLEDSDTLRDVYESMPGDGPAAMPWYVRAVENPASPAALPGAVDLFGHDCVHILLGRGMHSQDEAFVVGATMGSSRRLTGWQQQFYLAWSRLLYRGPYRFSRIDRMVFGIGVEFGRCQCARPLSGVPWPELMDRKLGELRAELGIDAEHLTAVYESERVLWPDSPVAARLPRAAARTTGDD